jgi:LmbE family N-acetylglucosaminyl deacetylase
VTWIFLSPHLDDIALSCGGLVWELAQRGEEVSVWTICAGSPPEGPLSAFAQELHARWQTPMEEAVQRRRQEDQAACQVLAAGYRYFAIPDCIYRPGGETGKFYYTCGEALFGELHPEETTLVKALAQELALRLPQAAQVVCPLTLGGHVDHRLTQAAAEKLGRALWYYADYPYVLQSADPAKPVDQAGWTSQVFPVSPEGLSAWQAAVAAHQSQISTFWADLKAMQQAIQSYWQPNGGVRLWKNV